MKNREIMVDWEQTDPQALAWDYLIDEVTNEILFGGGAGGGKSHLECGWLISMCMKFRGTRWCLGRSVLKRLKETTLNTFFDVAKDWGLVVGKDFKYNASSNIITFKNGSEILLKELCRNPSDPNFDRLGSLEITGAAIDEAQEVEAKAKNILQTRIRYKLTHFCFHCAAENMDKESEPIEWDEDGVPIKWKCYNCGKETVGITPKILYSCNPAMNWVYLEFYKPDKEKTLLDNQKFIVALVTDNPHASRAYIENLRRMKDRDPQAYKRLFLGLWEYDDDPMRMFTIDAISDMFSNTAKISDDKFLSVDVARFGKDKTVIGEWLGFKVSFKTHEHKRTTATANIINNKLNEGGIRASNTIIDEDGVGGGVIDSLRDHHQKKVKGFLNGSSPIQSRKFDNAKTPEEKEIYRQNYLNLRSQCYHILADMVRRGEIEIDCGPTIRDLIVEELEQIKETKSGRDGSKIGVTKKDDIKKVIGRSPDYSDTLMMRMYFTLRKVKKLVFAKV